MRLLGLFTPRVVGADSREHTNSLPTTQEILHSDVNRRPGRRRRLFGRSHDFLQVRRVALRGGVDARRLRHIHWIQDIVARYHGCDLLHRLSHRRNCRRSCVGAALEALALMRLGARSGPKPWHHEGIYPPAHLLDYSEHCPLPWQASQKTSQESQSTWLIPGAGPDLQSAESRRCQRSPVGFSRRPEWPLPDFWHQPDKSPRDVPWSRRKDRR